MLRQVLFATGLACTGYGLLVFVVREDLTKLLRGRMTGPPYPFEGQLLPVDAALLVLLGVWAMTWASDGWWKRRSAVREDAAK